MYPSPDILYVISPRPGGEIQLPPTILILPPPPSYRPSPLLSKCVELVKQAPRDSIYFLLIMDCSGLLLAMTTNNQK